MNANFSNEKEQIVFGNDNVVIKKYISGIEGGRTLDMTGYNKSDLVKAGQVIIKLQSGEYAPMPLTGSDSISYDSLPSGATYVGICVSTISKDRPACAIMTNGKVNTKALPYAMTSILSAFKSACPFIEFAEDEDSSAKFAVADAAKTIAKDASATTTISHYVGTVTASSSTTDITASVSGATVTIAVDENATATSGVVTLTDGTGAKATVTVTVGA